ncbi:hypothetical protein GCM10010399_06450 [Dactylosporangium fulvum]|uniref:Tyr recombinase domain-containing protein n=1 Tax=Dactylosporangium fulvum TaxID=53359 RepID=A0ABY5VWJ6_9ACTN|nr:hypothetical protein [Dactylosporangium fulvum]UWP81486.1 hypothetical protein Dfulv_41270 [Dactylosporangium fulvum]
MSLTPVRFRAMVYVAAGCGLRIGETPGLEVDDIDLEGREFHVRRQVDDETDPRNPARRSALLVFTSNANEPVKTPTWCNWRSDSARRRPRPG